MARLDLHMHSIHSDGVKPPEWVVRQAAANGAELMALTDHDTFSGVAAAQAAAEQVGISVLTGVEVGVNDSELGEVHVLGYFSDRADKRGIAGRLDAYRVERESRAQRTVDRLVELGLDVRYESVERIADGAAIGRPHIARALIEAGHVASVQEAFDRYLLNDGPAFVPRPMLGLAETVALIHEAGGFASLAHPSRYRESERAACAFADAGGDGIEIYYRRDNAETVANGRQLADRLGLVPTVGSDFHGLHPDEMLPATVSMPDHAAERLMELLKDLLR